MSSLSWSTMSLSVDDSNNSIDNQFDRVMHYYNTFKGIQYFDSYNNIYSKDMSTSSQEVVLKLLTLFSATEELIPLRQRLKRIRAENPRLDRAFITGSFD